MQKRKRRAFSPSEYSRRFRPVQVPLYSKSMNADRVVRMVADMMHDDDIYKLDLRLLEFKYNDKGASKYFPINEMLKTLKTAVPKVVAAAEARIPAYLSIENSNREFIDHCIRYKRRVDCIADTAQSLYAPSAAYIKHVSAILTGYDGDLVTATLSVTMTLTVPTGLGFAWDVDQKPKTLSAVFSPSSHTHGERFEDTKANGVVYIMEIPLLQSAYLHEIRQVLHDDCSAVVFSYI
jgi:hypothetical protein